MIKVRGMITMDQKDIMGKVSNVKTQTVEHEIFHKLRPPEELGDAVKLFYNEDEQTFRAVVFDPEMKTVFYEKTLPDADSTCAFIADVLDGKVHEQAHSTENSTFLMNDWSGTVDGDALAMKQG